MGNVLLNLKLQPTPMAPMTADGYIPDMKGVMAVTFQNVGTTNARLFNGMYTVLANGGSLSLNVTEDLGLMDILKLQVMFVGAGTNRLEILTLRPSAENTVLTCP